MWVGVLMCESVRAHVDALSLCVSVCGQAAWDWHESSDTHVGIMFNTAMLNRISELPLPLPARTLQMLLGWRSHLCYYSLRNTPTCFSYSFPLLRRSPPVQYHFDEITPLVWFIFSSSFLSYWQILLLIISSQLPKRQIWLMVRWHYTYAKEVLGF